jgi:hypothetical protein
MQAKVTWSELSDVGEFLRARDRKRLKRNA